MPKQPIEPSMSKLDEILTQAYTDGQSDTMWQNDRHIEIFATAKQAFLQWVNDEVISQERPYNKLEKCPVCGDYQYHCGCDQAENKLMESQRDILKQHGWKGDGNVQ